MTYYKVTHKYKLSGHYERKYIGIYSCEANADEAIAILKNKDGFKDTFYGFKTKKVFKIFKPKLLDRTFWVDGFLTYTY